MPKTDYVFTSESVSEGHPDKVADRISDSVVDLFLAIIRRTRAGRNPFAPDKQHLHHRLLEMGHSQARAVLVMYAWTGLISFTAVAVAFISVGYALLGFLVGLAGILIAIRPPVNRPLAAVKTLRTGTRN